MMFDSIADDEMSEVIRYGSVTNRKIEIKKSVSQFFPNQRKESNRHCVQNLATIGNGCFKH